MRYKTYSFDNKFIKETDSIPYNFTGIVDWYNGTKIWMINGKLHREDGPAVEREDGRKYWYIDNKEVTELQHKLLCDMMKLKGMI